MSLPSQQARPRPTQLADLTPMPHAEGLSPIPLPNAQQLRFQELGLGLFIHFGMNTFTGEGTGGRGEHPADIFNPTDLDCDDWMRVAASMGARFAVLTARHEEGFCLWPTATTTYSVAASPWRDGNGDVVGEFVAACRRHGIAPCLYHPSYMDARHVFKPGDPIAWHEDWFATTNRRLAEPGAAERFQAMQVAQIRELLTRYGDITYLWLDHIGETQGILEPAAVERFWLAIVDEARRLQPECLLLKADVYLSRDLDTAGGVHAGRASDPLWHACRRADTGEGQGDPSMDPLHADQYLVWEANTVFSGDWFWNGGQVKDLDAMIEHYYATIGRGSTFLPNFAPDRRGRMPDLVHARARAFGDWQRATFSTPVATARTDQNSLELQLDSPTTIAHIVLQEDLRHGQRIAAFTIEVDAGDGWQKLAEGHSIGQTRIIRLLDQPTIRALRWRCTRTWHGSPCLRSLAVHAATHL